MGICRKPKTTRWSEEELADINMLNEKYQPFTTGFSSVLRLAVKVLKAWTLMPEKVIQAYRERQQLQSVTLYDARQLWIIFPRQEDEVSFFPKFNGGQR